MVGILLYTVYEVGQIVWQANQNQQTETPSSSESPPESGYWLEKNQEYVVQIIVLFLECWNQSLEV